MAILSLQNEARNIIHVANIAFVVKEAEYFLTETTGNYGIS